MEIRYPDYYKKFHCIAGACPDTCCAGWEIPVDQKSEKRYRAECRKTEKTEFYKKLKKYIKDGHIVSEGETCPFLDKDGLCEMYRILGADALCRTCKNHPRHMEDYGELHEMILLLSCPEAARLILDENKEEFHVISRPERVGNTDGIDEKLLDYLLKTREAVWKTVKNPEEPVDKRAAFSVALIHDVQRRITKKTEDQIPDLLARYTAPDAMAHFFAGWKLAEQEECQRFLLMSDFMEELAELETVGGVWEEMLEKCRSLLYHSADSREKYLIRRKSFRESTCFDSDKERLLQYFIYSFFLAALYDRDALTKGKMALLSMMAAEELYLAQWIEKNGEEITSEERVRICHTLARQIENHDGNRTALEQVLRQGNFGARRLINALLETEER